jgi:hypothetical protein
MPILGLTDKQPELPRIGILRKGGKKTSETRPGPDLDYFRFVADDEAAAAAFDGAYGPRPREVNVFLPFPTIDQNWEAWKEDWKASALQHRCDGVTCVLWLTPRGTYSTEPRPCPGGCKQVGRLKVVIPELARYAIVTVLTTGKWDVMNLDASLKALDQIKSSPTLQGIPLVVRRVEREISTPEMKDNRPTGKRLRRKKWLLQIEAAPRWVALQLQAAERGALPVAPQLALPPASVIEADDHDDDGDEGIGEIVSPGRAAQSVQYDDFGESRPEIAPPAPAGEMDEAARVDQALLDHCVRQKGEKNGPAFFKAQYGAKSFDQKRALANSLGLLSAPALDALDAVEELAPTSESVIEEIEGLFTALKALGKTPAEMTGQVARLSGGEVDFEAMTLETLLIIRDGLAFWRDQTRDGLVKKGAGK